ANPLRVRVGFGFVILSRQRVIADSGLELSQL
ncbi:MAG: hypothetical protein ACJAX5_003695, partial [Patiriisocius sp.]